MEIKLVIGDESVLADLNDSKTASMIADALPIEVDFSTWGDEIYFAIPVKTGPENSVEVVELGDIAYWPPGNAFCIFYGDTPISANGEIRPASPVNPLGRIKGNPEVFKELARLSSTIRIEKA